MQTKYRFFAVAIVFSTAAMSFSKPLRADDFEPGLRIKILLTALTFDRTLSKRAVNRVNMVTFGDCAAAKVLEQATSKQIAGLPVSVFHAPEGQTLNGVKEIILEKAASVAYLCSANDSSLRIMKEVGAALKLIILADNPNWVGTAAAMGVAERNGRPKLILNLDNAKASGVDFDPRIFGFAEVVQ